MHVVSTPRAPQAIGPYSQAICEPLLDVELGRHDADAGESVDVDVDLNVNVHDAGLVEIVHVAGQIPLVPQSMEIEREMGFGESAVLSLQHLWRVGQERGVDIWAWGIAFLKAGEEEGKGNGSDSEGCRKSAELACNACGPGHGPWLPRS